MGRIRLQVCVLPWELPGSTLSGSARLPRETLKWCEPCTESTPMQEVCERIYKTWRGMYKDSEGPLRIRHLKTAYGDLVDLEERVVGDLFDDRGTDGNIRNSILEVYRYPPKPDELEYLQRFSSLAPTSSARPRKRPLELPSQPYPSQNSPNVYRELPSIEGADAETRRPIAPAAKRQRTSQIMLNRTFDLHQPLERLEKQEGQLHPSSQTSGTQSVHQVPGSQNFPAKKRPNPYGTPSSLSIVDQQESINRNEIDLSGVPDSPLGGETALVNGAFGGAMDPDRESTKSESPELRESVPVESHADPIDTSGEQHPTSNFSPEPSASSPIFSSAPQPSAVPLIVDNYAKNQDLCVTHYNEKGAGINTYSKKRPAKADSAHPHDAGSNGETLRKSDLVYDFIESDTESFREKQRMQSAKRLKSSKAGRRDGQFLVACIPPSRSDRDRILLDEFSSQEQPEDNHTHLRGTTHSDISVQADLQQRGRMTGESFNHLQPEALDGNRINKCQETLRSNSVSKDVVGMAQTSFQANTAGSQAPCISNSGTRKSISQQRDGIVSSQEQMPAKVIHPVHNNDRLAQEAERTPKNGKEQQEMKQIGETKFEEQRAIRGSMEKKDAAKKKAFERNATEDTPVIEKEASEEKARAEQLAQAGTHTLEEERLMEAKSIEKTRANAARLAEKKTTERLARERQIKESTLTQQAEDLQAVAEGAKQIELEKKEKEQARLKALQSKKKDQESKNAEQAREAQGKSHEKKNREEQSAQQSVQELPRIDLNDAKHRIYQAKSPLELVKSLKKQGQKRIADRDMQKLRDSSGVPSQASTMPLASSSTPGPMRSMTPAMPGFDVAKSSQNSLGSSPLNHRSSEAPLRSAFRQPSSALRRSVSSVSFDVLPGAKSNEYVPSTPNLKSLKETNDERASTSSAKPSPWTETNQSSTTPIKTFVSRKAQDTKVVKTPAKKGKVQTTLNVTREVKKGKGRADGRPITPIQAPEQGRKQTPKQEIVLSSGEISTTAEEPVWQTGNAEAGPSFRKPMFPVTNSAGKKTAEVKSLAAPIDPMIRKRGVTNDKISVPATLPHSTPSSDTKSLQKPTSRSPSLASSDASSMGSTSASEEVSDADLKSDSEVKPQAPSSTTPTGPMDGKLTPVTMKAVSKAASMVIEEPESHMQSKGSSQSRQASSSRDCSLRSSHDDGKRVKQAANKQLQLESRSSVPSPRSEQASTMNDTGVNMVVNQGLNHAGRLPNGTRPANYRYPCLSELQKVPRPSTPEGKPIPDIASAQPCGALPVEEGESSQTSSDSDESSSDSDDEDVGEPTGPARIKKESGHYPGMRAVLKLAKAVQSKLRPGQ